MFIFIDTPHYAVFTFKFMCRKCLVYKMNLCTPLNFSCFLWYFLSTLLFLGLKDKKNKTPFESPTIVRFQEEMDVSNSFLDCNETINQFGVE